MCRRHAGAAVEELAAAIEEALQRFLGGSPFADDRTLVMAQRLEAF